MKMKTSNLYRRSYGGSLLVRVERADCEDRTDHQAERELARMANRRNWRVNRRALARRNAANSPW